MKSEGRKKDMENARVTVTSILLINFLPSSRIEFSFVFVWIRLLFFFILLNQEFYNKIFGLAWSGERKPTTDNSIDSPCEGLMVFELIIINWFLLNDRFESFYLFVFCVCVCRWMVWLYACCIVSRFFPFFNIHSRLDLPVDSWLRPVIKFKFIACENEQKSF